MSAAQPAQPTSREPARRRVGRCPASWSTRNRIYSRRRSAGVRGARLRGDDGRPVSRRPRGCPCRPCIWPGVASGSCCAVTWSRALAGDAGFARGRRGSGLRACHARRARDSNWRALVAEIAGRAATGWRLYRDAAAIDPEIAADWQRAPDCCATSSSLGSSGTSPSKHLPKGL